MIHFTLNTSVYEQISTCDCSIFAHNISLSEIFGQATYTTWWRHIDPFGPTCYSFHYSSLFPSQWPSSTLVQPVWLNSVLAESIWQHLGWHTHPGALGFREPQCHSQARYRIPLCLPVIMAGVRIIQITIPAKPMFIAGNAFRCTISITSGWMTVDSFDSANILYFRSSSRVVLCRQSGWQWWSFWQFECSCTSMLTIWPGWSHDLFGIWNVSNSCHLLDLGTRFFLGSM